MQTHELKLIYIDGTLCVSFNDMPKPDGEEYMFTRNVGFDATEHYFDKELFNADTADWHSRVKYADIRDDDVKVLKMHAMIFANTEGMLLSEWDERLKAGISLESISESIGIDIIDTCGHKDCVCPMGYCVMDKKFMYVCTVGSVEEVMECNGMICPDIFDIGTGVNGDLDEELLARLFKPKD